MGLGLGHEVQTLIATLNLGLVLAQALQNKVWEERTGGEKKGERGRKK